MQHTITKTGLIRTNNGWAVAKLWLTQDEGSEEYRESRRRLLAGPFPGAGSKVRAIKANGGDNTVIA